MKPAKPWSEFKDGDKVTLPACGASTEQIHVFDQRSIDAVNAAMAARRPLLVRGEPGTGKSQLACAAAVALNRPCLSQVVDSRTSAQDLLWTFDAVARLAEAQVAGMAGEGNVRNRLQVKRFVTPGPLWWALDWKSAREQAQSLKIMPPPTPDDWKESEGSVMLIDEIDKADSDTPNGLLEVLGQGSFKVHGFEETMHAAEVMPLVVITTNEERALPDAFLRRCLVLHIELPADAKALEDLLVQRGQAHFPKAAQAVLRKAAEQLVKDREDLKKRRLPAPGQAEYLDLVRALTNLKSGEAAQIEILDQIAPYVLQKHPKDSAG
jgi:MoxR-like ATPase